MPDLPPARLRWGAFILQCGRVNLRGPKSSTVQDESFAIRDGQFNNPYIGILLAAPVQIVPKFRFIFNILLFCTGPFSASVQLRHAFMQSAKSLIIHKDHKNRTAIGLALVQHGGKAARSLSRADQARHFDSGRKAGIVQECVAQAGIAGA